MNKTAIRNFAVWARNKLIADVSCHAGLMGITRNGISQALPQSTKDVEFFDIGTAEPYAVRGEAIRQKEKDSNYETAYSSLMEEVAYTWFNRLIAVRFMEVNDYLPAHVRVLSAESGKQEPDIVTNPFDAELFFAEGENQKIIQMKNDNKLDEVFRILFLKQCRELSRILPRLFEGTNDYTELLLSVSFIDQEGVVYHLVHDIPEEDFNVEQGGQVEIIGWLYQYYNDEKKNEVININKSTISKEDIPAATQLFTTDWVVRYIVDNSLGKYWIERHPNSRLKDSLEYLIISKMSGIDIVQDEISPEQIKVFDPCMGSGHFLVYAFDVLMKIYEESGYTQRDAAKSIVEKNIYGLDIDHRAAQLAYFAVMMKARQYNRRIIDGQTKCNILPIVESNGFDDNCLVKLGDLRKTAEKLLSDFKDAKVYGTTIQLSVESAELDQLEERLVSIDKASDYGNLIDMLYSDQLWNGLMPLIEQARIMLNKYHVVDTNPPYLNKYDEKFKSYLNDKYKDYSGDLFSVFMYRNLGFCIEKGYTGFMTPYVWMFIKTYEKLREYIIDNKTIDSLIQMEYSAFEEATVPICSFVLRNCADKYDGKYIKLSTFKGGMEVQKQKVLDALRENFNSWYCYTNNQNNYKKIPGCPIAFWASENLFRSFDEGSDLEQDAAPKGGLATSDNARFLRLWYEVVNERIGFDASSTEETNNRDEIWYPIAKGGDYRKWYGNREYVVNWYHDGEEIKYAVVHNPKDPNTKTWSRRIFNFNYYFAENISWSGISSGSFSVRYTDHQIFGAGGKALFSEDLKYYEGFLNSCVALEYLNFISPTLNYESGHIAKLPILKPDEETKSKISTVVGNNNKLSKEDWDSFETSWDFKKHPLI